MSEVVGCHPGESPIVLVSNENTPEETICKHLDPRCVSISRTVPETAMERVY